MYCRHCLRELPENEEYAFCPYCGEAVADRNAAPGSSDGSAGNAEAEEAAMDAEAAGAAKKPLTREAAAEAFQGGIRKAATFRISDLWNRKDLGPVRAVLYLPGGIVGGAVIGSILGTIRGSAMFGFGVGIAVGAAIGCVAALSELTKK